MVQTSKQKPVQDKRKQQINAQAKSHSLEYVIAAAQILTILCLFKGNPAWKGSLSLLFFGVAFELFYKNQQYAEKHIARWKRCFWRRESPFWPGLE